MNFETSVVPMHQPQIVTDGGPWAYHDYACPVCRTNKAVLNLSADMFEPCWGCQRKGWRIRRVWWKR